MNMQNELETRSGGQCELCGSKDDLRAFAVSGAPSDGAEGHVLICETCANQIEHPDQTDPNHWRCLNDSMWSPVPAVQVMAWRMLNRLRGEGWPQDLLDMLFLDDETLRWAKSAETEAETAIVHKDSNGNVLEAGDTVTLIQDLKVKGANFTAKRGTAVRRISLVADNPEQIEGRVEGQHIVILTKFVKKQK